MAFFDFSQLSLGTPPFSSLVEMAFPASPLKLLDLPTELLVEICWQSNNAKLVLVCTHICNIILSTPLFWGYIHIGERQHTGDAAEFLTKRLERGGNSPLEVDIQTTEPLARVLGIPLWRTLAMHKDRIHILGIRADTVPLLGRILHAVLLSSGPEVRPSLQKLDIRPTLHSSTLNSNLFKVVHGPFPDVFPALTTLVLSVMWSCLPNLTSPLPTLETLVFDGTIFLPWPDDPIFFQLANFLSKTPRLHTLWYKEHFMLPYADPTGTTAYSSISLDSNTGNITYPLLLPRLTRLAITVPGVGAWLLQAINAPALRDLHLDGMRDDDEFGDAAAWLDTYPAHLHAILRTTAGRSPALRRIALVGAYLARDTWEWLLGCGPAPTCVPFPLLDSVAVRAMEHVKWQVTNMVDDALIELYAQRGRLSLRRFAYTASEPSISGPALHQLIGSIQKRQAAGELFELEMDGQYGVDTKDRLLGLLEMGIKATLRTESFPAKCWWNLGKDIDPSEADSY